MGIDTRRYWKFFSVTAVIIALAACAGRGAAGQTSGGAQVQAPPNIAAEFLDLEKRFCADRKASERLDRLLEKARSAVATKESYTTEEAITVLKSIDALIKAEGFTFKNNLLLCTGLRTGKIDCDNYSALYTAIAETVKVPVIPVYAPNHSFVRFFFDDGSYVNWEPIKGQSLPDAQYKKLLGIADRSLQKGVYLKSLSRKEFIGVEYNNIGAYLMTQKKFGDAASYFSMAIQMYPAFSSAYHNRGTALYATAKLDAALADLLVAADLDPLRPETQNTLGDVYFDLKQYDRAVERYKASIALDPKNYVPYYSIGLVMKTQGRNEEAKQWLQKAEKLMGGR
jgi:tetratricopeptide (TPR) repeat protein